MAELTVHGHGRAGLLWLTLKRLHRTKERGILGLHREDFTDWFWIQEGYVAFAWHDGSRDHLFDVLNGSGLVSLEIMAELALEIPRSRPAEFLEAMPRAAHENPRWDQVWLEYYGRRLADYLACPDEFETAWTPAEWNLHESMIIVDIPTWVRQALAKVDDLSVFQRYLQHRTLRVRTPDTAPIGADPLTQQVVEKCGAGVPLDTCLERLEEPDLIKHLWYMIWRGDLTLVKEPAPAEPTWEELLEQLLFYYDQAFRYVYDYLHRELEDLAAPVLEKNFAQIRTTYPLLFGDLTPDPGGGAESWHSQLHAYVNGNAERLAEVGGAMEELLMSHLLTVQNILGLEHYSTLVELLKTLHRVEPQGQSIALNEPSI